MRHKVEADTKEVVRLKNVLQEADDRLRKNLSEEQRAVVFSLESLVDLSESSGLFLRIAPVQSRLNAGGLYGVGRSSGKLSKRSEDNGYVAILHDPATLKIEFAIPQNKAKQIKSIRARVIEMPAEEWERLDDKDRCKVVR